MGFLASLALCCDSQDRDLPVTQSRGLPAKREEWLPGVRHPPPSLLQTNIEQRGAEVGPGTQDRVG